MIELTAESELVLHTFGEHIFNRFVEIKRQEWEDYRVQVSQWELDRSMSILFPQRPPPLHGDRRADPRRELPGARAASAQDAR